MRLDINDDPPGTSPGDHRAIGGKEHHTYSYPTHVLPRVRLDDILAELDLMSKSSRPATPPQVRYLQALRTRIGIDAWLQTKAALGIRQPGTYNLSFTEANVLIQTILEQLEDTRCK